MIEETLELIATRVPPGDKWKLVGDKEVHESLTKALNAWYLKTKEKAEFRLAPLDSKIYVIRTQEVAPPEPETFDIYGENY